MLVGLIGAWSVHHDKLQLFSRWIKNSAVVFLVSSGILLLLLENRARPFLNALLGQTTVFAGTLGIFAV